MKYVIIGNGPAGIVAAETLRKTDATGSIQVIGAEPEAPYSRMAIPYLVAGNIEIEGTYLRKDEAHFRNLGIELIRGSVSTVDAKAKNLKLDDGKTFAFDKLLIASGSSPAIPPIPGMDLPNVHACWTLENARRIIDSVKPGSRVLQMGAGFVSCIVIDPLRKRGAKVTIVGSGDRMVPRMMTPGASKLIQKWVERNGIRILNNARVNSLSAGENGTLVAHLSTGENVEADLVINATGVKANIGFLENSGIETEYGILVNEYLQTSQPDVFAAGDVAQAQDIATGGKTVNAIQPNAVDQGRIAALNMTGKSVPFNGGIAMNVLDVGGLVSASFGRWWGAEGGEHVELMDENGWRYLRLEFKDDVMVGATSVGLTQHVGVLRGLIQARIPLGDWKGHLLRDPTRIMEAYLAKAQAATI